MTTTSTTKFGVGQAVRRKEDQRFLTGAGRYTDDINVDRQLHAHFVRSPHAHARILSINVDAARAAPGVVAVYTHADMAAAGINPIPVLTDIPVKTTDGGIVSGPPRHALAADAVRYVGDAVALVIAQSHAQAVDAAERIEVRYETLPAVIGPAEAVKPGAHQLWPGAKGNVAGVFAVGDAAAVNSAMAGAAHIVKLDLVNNRLAPNTMEPRAVLCEFDSATKRYTVHVASQASQGFKMALAAAILQVPPDNVRVIVDDIGGGFGMKVGPYPEYVAVCFAAGKLGRPVKWVASRSEAFLADTHGRAHVTHAEMGLDASGRIVALKIRNLADMGAYLAYVGPLVPTIAAGQVITNVYDIKLMHLEILCVLTNTSVVDAYRGAGRPESVFMMERLMDLAAAQTRIDPAEIRRRNMIPSAALPYTTLLGAIYDSGDYAAIMARGLREADWAGFASRKAKAAQRGKLAGRGFSTYVEITGAFDPVEHVQVTVSGDGKVTLIAGTQAMGQGLDTSYCQLLAEKLGVPFDSIDVIQGDTDIVKAGSGSIGSRSSFVGGQAVLTGGDEIIKRGRDLAADALESAAADISFADGRFAITGTDRGIGLFELARKQTDARIHVSATSTAGGMSYPNGINVCEVEIDRETGEISISRFMALNDVGTVINPMIVAGQVHGGVVQGVGQALHEQVVYDRSGQLVTGSYLDYCMPRADDMPQIETSTDESTPSPTNIIGAKGAGEAGAVSAPPAVVSAIVNALADYGVSHLDMPIRTETIWRILQQAR
ncbi:MAG: xanthine dehydrogenase family protein molybdopterin-binding subunit [Burkholderiales bacterium]